MDHYAHGNTESVLAAHRGRTAANSAAYLLGRLKPGLRLLDVGCGEGTITRGLAQAVSPGLATGIDAAPEVIAGAVAAGGPPNLRFQVGDAYALDFPTASFDVVHAHQVLHHLSDPVAALTEMARVTRPGGLIALREADFGGAFWFPESESWQAWRDVLRQVLRRGGSEPDAARRLLAWTQAAGLTKIECSGSVWTYPGMDSAAAWAGSWAERLTGSHTADLAIEAGLADSAGLARTAQGLRAWAATPGAWFAMPHGEGLVTR
jgi:ubiquinone/menaquinone biosynthesis C-methylase UbiE